MSPAGAPAAQPRMASLYMKWPYLDKVTTKFLQYILRRVSLGTAEELRTEAHTRWELNSCWNKLIALTCNSCGTHGTHGLPQTVLLCPGIGPRPRQDTHTHTHARCMPHSSWNCRCQAATAACSIASAIDQSLRAVWVLAAGSAREGDAERERERERGGDAAAHLGFCLASSQMSTN